MGRDDVNVSKVWAPTLEEIQDKVSHSENVHTTVVKALTRDLGNMSVAEFVPKIYETVEKCSQKAEKVIVSLVVPRYDKKDIEAKVDLVNANIKFKYLNNSNILICSHNNLDDKKYRKHDKLHLNEFGRSRYANNFKYSIAESLGVTIEKRRQYPDKLDKNNSDQRNINVRGRYRDNRFNERYQFDDHGYPFENYGRLDEYNQYNQCNTSSQN